MNANKDIIKDMTAAVLNDESIEMYADDKDLGKTEDIILKERLSGYVKFLQDSVFPSLLTKAIGKCIGGG